MQPSETLPVSACILAQNEADALPRCIDSVRFCREVLICDTGSTDNTPAVARALGARVLSTRWVGFSETRRQLFTTAGEPWILWIDADEVVDPRLAQSIDNAITSPGTAVGFEINRQVVFQGRRIRHGDWFPDWVLRLFQADQWEMDSRLVHESVRVTGPTRRLDGLLDHHSFRDLGDLRRRGERYADLWAENHRERHPRPSPAAPIIHAGWRWIRGYLLRGGFLDGSIGWDIARANARETALKYQRLREIQRSG